jgi:hypothetical protein
MILVYVGQFAAFREWKHRFPHVQGDEFVHYLSGRSLRGRRGKAKLIVGWGATPQRIEEAMHEVDMLNALWTPDYTMKPMVTIDWGS